MSRVCSGFELLCPRRNSSFRRGHLSTPDDVTNAEPARPPLAAAGHRLFGMRRPFRLKPSGRLQFLRSHPLGATKLRRPQSDRRHRGRGSLWGQMSTPKYKSAPSYRPFAPSERLVNSPAVRWFRSAQSCYTCCQNQAHHTSSDEPQARDEPSWGDSSFGPLDYTDRRHPYLEGAGQVVQEAVTWP